jgi:hypothetical protein
VMKKRAMAFEKALMTAEVYHLKAQAEKSNTFIESQGTRRQINRLGLRHENRVQRSKAK